MTAPNAMLRSAFMLAQDLNTRGLQGWIQDNVIPLVLLGIAIILLWIGGRGDNAGVARRSVGLIVGLIALGIAVSGNGPQIGTFLAQPAHGLTAVLVRTDDEVYRVDSVWLGPPRATFPWRARYVSYGLGSRGNDLGHVRAAPGRDRARLLLGRLGAGAHDRRHPVPRANGSTTSARSGRSSSCSGTRCAGRGLGRPSQAARSGPDTSASRVPRTRPKPARRRKKGRVRAAA